MRLTFTHSIWLFFIAIILTMHHITANMVHTKNDKLYLVSSCHAGFAKATPHTKEDLIEVVDALRKLASKLHEKVDLNGEIQVIEDSGQQKFEIEITPYLTERIQILLKRTVSYAGPNCFNAVLYFLQILDHLRFVSQDEINYYLTKSGLFIDVTDTTLNHIEAGDIGAVFIRKEEIIHTFIYLTDKIILDKGGSSKNEEYKVGYLSERLVGYPPNYSLRYYRRIPCGIEHLRYQLLKIDEITDSIIQILENEDLSNVEILKKKKLLIQNVLAYHRYIAHLLRNDKDNSYIKIILPSWKSVLLNISKLIYSNTKISCSTVSGLTYQGKFKSIFLNGENKCILSLKGILGKNQYIESSSLDLQTIVLEEYNPHRYHNLRTWMLLFK